MNRSIEDKIYDSYFLPCFLIGILPIIIPLLWYMNYHNMVSEEMQKSQVRILSQMKNSFDNDIGAIISTGHNLETNPIINALMSTEDFTNSELLGIIQLENELNTIQTSINSCKDLFVYLYKSESFITDDKLYNTKTADIYANTFNLSKDNLLKHLDIPDRQGYSVINTNNGDAILFIQNLYHSNSKEKLASIVMVVPREKLSNHIVFFDQGEVYWVNEKNQILSLTDQKIFNHPLYKDYVDENKLMVTSDEDKKYVTSYLDSNYYDFKYCVSVPKSYYMKGMNRLRYMVLTQIVTILVLSVFLAGIYTKKILKPAAGIISLMRKNKDVIEERICSKNAQAYIDNLYTENQIHNKNRNTGREALINQVVIGYVKEWNMDETSLEDMIKAHSKLSLRKFYIAIVITYQDVMECKLFHGIKDIEKEKTFHLLRFVFRNIFDETILSKYNGLFCDIDGMNLCIINIPEDRMDQLAYDIRKSMDVYQDLLNLKVNVGASKVHSNIHSLPGAYQEAVQALEFQAFWGKEAKTFYAYHDSYKKENLLYHSDSQMLEKQKKLYNFLYVKEYDKAIELINQILDEIFIKDIRYMEINKCRLFGLIDTICNCLSDIFGKSDSEFLKELHPMQRMLSAGSVVSTRQVINEILNEVMDHLEINIKGDQPKWILDIMNLVSEKYDDPNLNVSVLADRLNMNLSYIGRAFKEYTGYSIMDLIHMKRVEECKKRLILGDSVREAAETIGYLDSKSLIRIFKKYEGITPGQFKSNFENAESKLA